MVIEITIGGETWPVRGVTLRQHAEIQRILASDDSNFVRGMAIVKLALARDHKESADGLDDHEGTITEIDDAAGAILRMGGWLPPLDQPSEPATER